MALTTQQLKGSCSTFNPVPSSWIRGSKLKYCVPVFHVVGRKDRSTSLKCRSYSSVRTSVDLGPKVSAFKGASQYDYSGGRGNSSKSQKNSFKVSYVQHTSEESPVESPKEQNIVPTPHTAADETTTSSLAIQNLFKSWLMLLRIQPQTQAVLKVREEPFLSETSEIPKKLAKQSGNIPKAIWCYFVGVDATIKVPILLLTLMYLAVNIVYGSRVSRELAPLWILGPFIVALYVKMFQSICRLYAFCFNQTAKVVKSLPLVGDYILHWKLKKPLKTFVFQPLADLKYMKYKELSRIKMRDFQMWLHEIYLDYLVLAWPYHYRTRRFLKMLNF